MYTLKIENSIGQVLTLTDDETQFQVVKIDGLNPPQAIINRSTIAGMDGSKYASARLGERNIVITIKPNGNVERNRNLLYQYFRIKQWCKVYYSNGVKNVNIEGYVEGIEFDLFTINELIQISIICPDSYFKDAQEIVDDISKVSYEFTFPFAFGENGATQDGVNIISSITDDAREFSTYDYERITEIVNDSGTEIGMIIEITFTDTVESPRLINTVTGEEFQVLGDYKIGDMIVINTQKGYKNVKLIRDGVETNLFSKLVFGSTWLQLRLGPNYFSYGARRNDMFMRVLFKRNNMYEGV